MKIFRIIMLKFGYFKISSLTPIIQQSLHHEDLLRTFKDTIPKSMEGNHALINTLIGSQKIITKFLQTYQGVQNGKS